MRHRRGFTLIEIMVALAIAAMLSMAAMAVVANLARSQAASKRTEGAAFMKTGLRRLLATDVDHADRYRVLPNGIELHSRAAIDPASLEVRHFESVIGYKTIELGADVWLVREQQSEMSGMLTELASKGVKTISIEPINQDNTPLPNNMRGPATRSVGIFRPQGLGEWSPMPQGVRVTLELSGSGSEPMEYRFSRGW